MGNYYQEKIEDVLKELDVSAEKGLSTQEAKNRLEKYGPNELAKKKKESIFLKILEQFKDVSVIILLIAGILSLALAIKEGEGYVEPIVIFSIIIMNTILAVSQEKSAEKSLEALSALSAPKCHVIRDGEVQEINTSEVVPGDILTLKTGDLVPADARLISSDVFTTDESSLTGESEPTKKHAELLYDKEVTLGDRLNSIYSSCLVLTGHATAVVTASGMHTEIGKIAGFLSEKKKVRTPLQVRLDKVSRAISILAVVSALTLFGIGLYQNYGPGGTPSSNPDFIWQLVLIAVTLAVAAVPETLALIVTLILMQGVKRMVAKKALIVKLQSVETLGSTSVICSDKTGTLTMNKMTVKRLYLAHEKPFDEDKTFDEEEMRFLKYLVLASNTSVGKDENGKIKIIGDPTETAIISLAIKKNIDIDALRNEYQKVGEIPFSSLRKKMTNIVKDPAGGYIVLTKGAFDQIPFAKKDDEDYMYKLDNVHDSFAKDALRVLSLGYKKVDSLPGEDNLEILENDLIFVGFIGIIDPPRPEAALAIKKAKSAGIRTIMITGDHAVTATAIARQLGILLNNEGVMTGQELEAISDKELEENIEFYSVFARITPEGKIRVVKALQSRGEVVAMTGDGVNDAPALKAADVGIAMGINGTEVSKSAADMVLMDDNFATIIEAVHEGRNVFSNIRKLIYFLLVCNISEIIMMLFGQIVGWPLVLTPLMLLLINVIGDGVPGMALAKEISDPRIMDRKPIDRDESFFEGGLLEVIIKQTFAFALVTLIAFYVGNFINLGDGNQSVVAGQTMAFLVTGWTSILHVLTVRSRKSVITYRFKDNPQLFISMLVMFVVFGLFAEIPGLNVLLGFTNLSLYQWLIVAGLTLFPLIVAEYGKFWDNVKDKTNERNRVKSHRSYKDD